MYNRNMKPQQFDALIIGAGISGISAAYHLQKHCPDKTYAMLEQRHNLGGTWQDEQVHLKLTADDEFPGIEQLFQSQHPACCCLHGVL